MYSAGGQADPVRAASRLRADAGPNQRLGRRQRLVRSSAFREAYAQGHSYTGRLMVFWLRSAPDAALRLGVVTSRKVGGAAVRVRARRRVREAWRRCRPFFKGDFDVVIVARRSITDASWPELVKEMLWLAGRLKLLDGSRDEVLNKVLDITP